MKTKAPQPVRPQIGVARGLWSLSDGLQELIEEFSNKTGHSRYVR
jgi:hypothetical protein